MRRFVIPGAALLLFAAACSDSTGPTKSARRSAGAHIAAATGTTPSGATLTTDKDDYQPGDVLRLSGSGWPAGDVLAIHLDETPQNHAPVDWTVTADSTGAVADSTYVVQDSDLGVTFTITGTSEKTGEVATATFTDGPPVGVSPVLWTGNGLTDGVGGKICGTTSSDLLTPIPDGKKGWLFVLQQITGTPDDWRLDVNFGPGTTDDQTGLSPIQVVGKVAKWAVYSDANATLDGATATATAAGGVSAGVLTVSHCALGDPVVHDADALTVIKDAIGSYDLTYKWKITKSVDKTLVEQFGGSAIFNYTVKVEHDAGTAGNWKVTGKITVSNPNSAPVHITSVTDAITGGGVCTVTGGGAQNIPVGDTEFAYSCTFASAPSGSIDNTATVTWDAQTVAGENLAAGSANWLVESITLTENKIDESISVSDSYAGLLGTVGLGDPNPKSFTYSRTITVPAYNCQSYDNTAEFTTNDTGTKDSSSQTVKVCGPAKTGALTIGYWQNKNGQAIITTGAATAGVCNSGTWLRQYAPFQDLGASATCNQVATYVTNVIKAANASGASMNAMLKAQMLATALDVYFSDAALGGNKINAPAPLGGVSIDLTKICKNIAACTIFENTSSVFGGTPRTVLLLLSDAASQSNAGGTTWYGNVKATQELAKDSFDAINNEKAFAP